MKTTRSLAAMGAVVLLASAVATVIPGPYATASSPDAVTKLGVGEFSSLKVTVSQTSELVNQVVRVSWSGGKPTLPEFGNLGINYLQIMQCWGGTMEDGPPREQCQYGSQKNANGGQNTNSRQMSTAGFVDPEEDKYDEYRSGSLSFIPFDSWTGKRTTGNRSEFFDRNTSNESNHNRTRSDGTGEDFFEIQTGVEAPGLGCGLTRDGESPLCWLVVVPRGEAEVDGTRRGITYTEGLETSPLLTSNWRNRIAFPLEFQIIGDACRIGGDETPLAGSDRIVEAIARWQPALCSEGSGNFSFSVLPDSQARAKLVSDNPGLVFTGYGVDPDEAAGPVVYAPIALSGLTVAFNVESQSTTLSPRDVRLRDGQRVGNIRLTQRLVAKLLTQSYRYDAMPDVKRVEKNPWDLASDPDFIQLNPQFKDLRFPALGHMVTTLGQTDSARLLWDWIWADKEARAWIQGKPDQWGMQVNPIFKRETYPRSDYPRSDNKCVLYTDRTVPLCTFDLFPYAGDLYAAARAASRGDTMSTGTYDPVGVPPGYKRNPLQEPGRRAMVVVADTPLTDRFSLTPAALRNANGEFVLPTEASVRKAAARSKTTGVEGVVQPNPAQKIPGAYPLTSYTYAATVPAELDKRRAEEYARLISYAAGPGQTLGNSAGQLPLGYAPLSPAERQSAAAAAKTIVATAGVKPKPKPETEPGDSDTNDGAPDGTDTTSPDFGSGGSFPGAGGFTDSGFTPGNDAGDFGGEPDSPDVEGEETDEADAGPDSEGATSVAVTEISRETPATAAQPVGPMRYVTVVLLLVGAAALLAGAYAGRFLNRLPISRSSG